MFLKGVTLPNSCGGSALVIFDVCLEFCRAATVPTDTAIATAVATVTAVSH